jgi:purine-binding chemotaxis protein CheW
MTELFLIARIAGRGVAVPSAQVVSVVEIGQVVAVPRAPHAVRGLAALRSRVVTVIDTAAALGERHAGEGARAIIMAADGHEYALLVDALEDVVSCEAQPLSSGLALDRGWAAAGIGMVEHGGEPLLILDLAALVPAVANAA